ncbi:RidA family protein [Arenibaculum sp.]|jgi:enamine deaminase RidA (YjgF/YER057c/UK114 family)|uniref:RidA family protein n=1 Tax=Arenibaculum sp. TaxID=2865862 RepID=UPI002E0E6765|nr:RidA family protein [Arenibaculum sp.]
MAFSPSLWEGQIGYARAVRVNDIIFVAGTVAADGTGMPQGSNAYEQTLFIIKKMRKALEDVGANIKHVTCTTTHLVSIEHFDDYAKAHKEFFDEIRPVNTTVVVNSLVRPEFLVEIGAVAIVAN